MLYFEAMPIAVLWMALIAALGLLGWGGWLHWRMALIRSGEVWEVRRLVLFARSLRALLSGVCLGGWALGWLYDSRWVIIASIVIGLEELYETSMALAFLEKIEENERAMAIGGLEAVG